MEKVRVSLKKKIDYSYGIFIEKALLNKLPAILKKNKIGQRYAIICDSNTKKMFGQQLLAGCKKAGLRASLLSFPAGEQSKSLEMLAKLQNQMLLQGFDRKSTVIALGGGVTGDLAGFVAATYMRGIACVQVPTTLLAMVDSSIGGKVAIDLPKGKNMCGVFFQPNAVFIDLNCLRNLPSKQLSNGLAEVVKHAVVADKKLFKFLEKNKEKILRKDLNVLGTVVKRNCEIKAAVVERDEQEKNLRKILNYGHTVGHALEVLGNYSRFSHGEAVSIGMAAAGLVSNRLGLLSLQELERQNALLTAFGLPIRLPRFSVAEIIEAMRHDKKAEKGKAMFVLPAAIGKMKAINGKYAIVVDEKLVKKVLSELQ